MKYSFIDAHGYIGESTKKEIDYAKRKGKACVTFPVYRLFQEALWNSTKPPFYILNIAQTNL
ncbi:hypothetical protein CVD28_25080 [Bacillus sp. M6-12]|nr:hypothetical protein CVD28_25080 [Bacillus sp. M6-12]